LELEVHIHRAIERRLLVDGRKVGAGRYLGVCPIFSLTPSDRELVTGGASERRRFLDRLTFLLEPKSLTDLRAYRRLLRQRNAGLERARGPELAAWEARLAAAGARVVAARRAVLDEVASTFQGLYRGFVESGFPPIDIQYRGERWLKGLGERLELEETYQQRYNATRARDRRAGATQEGPHRHDVVLTIQGRPAKDVLSSGQIRVVAAALRLATVALVEASRGERFPVLIDDVDAELDQEVFGKVCGWLEGSRQIVLSSARPRDIFERFPGVNVLAMESGMVRRSTVVGSTEE
jgi:DNA replication and repair protein RecF